MNSRIHHHRILFGLLCSAAAWLPCATAICESIAVESVHLKLIREIEVPAREAGVLANVTVKEGAVVKQGETIASIVDDEAQLALARAQLDLQVAEKKAEAKHEVRQAQAEYTVASRNLQRAKDSVAKFERSVSPAEMDRFQLQADQTQLAIEKAEFARQLARLESSTRNNDLQAAKQRLNRHTIVAPFPGMVAEVQRFRGEWVEPGQTVVRMIRLDQLKAEGFVDASQIQSDLRGMRVQLTVELTPGKTEMYTGKIVFVSAEVEPVSRQSRIWAEIDNKGQRLKPGLPARMKILVP